MNGMNRSYLQEFPSLFHKEYSLRNLKPVHQPRFIYFLTKHAKCDLKLDQISMIRQQTKTNTMWIVDQLQVSFCSKKHYKHEMCGCLLNEWMSKSYFTMEYLYLIQKHLNVIMPPSYFKSLSISVTYIVYKFSYFIYISFVWYDIP